MKPLTVALLAASLALAMAGCKKSADLSSAVAASQPPSPPQSAEAQIRIAIEAHLAHTSNLNLKAFDMDMKQVTVNGDHAQAQVDFRVKGGPGVMELTYQLESREGSWAVVEKNPVGSNFSHPPLDQSQAPAAMSAPGGASHSLADTLRSFKVDGTSNPSPSLPPGHPPITNNPSAMPQ